MKLFNLSFSILFGILAVVAFVVSFLQNRFDTACLGVIFAVLAYVSYQDFENPQMT
jgi:lipopolysaccharide export LptBFGC system permease protein LptF